MLLNHLIHTQPKNRILNEFTIDFGNSRADVMSVNEDEIIGYEIKGDTDNLLRLPRQIESYNKIFDYCYIVVSDKYINCIQNYIPEQWGVIHVKDDINIKRAANSNITKDIRSMLSVIWKEELGELLRQSRVKGYSNKTCSLLMNMIIENISEATIQEYVRHTLKNRSWIRRNRCIG